MKDTLRVLDLLPHIEKSLDDLIAACHGHGPRGCTRAEGVGTSASATQGERCASFSTSVSLISEPGRVPCTLGRTEANRRSQTVFDFRTGGTPVVIHEIYKGPNMKWPRP